MRKYTLEKLNQDILLNISEKQTTSGKYSTDTMSKLATVSLSIFDNMIKSHNKMTLYEDIAYGQLKCNC